ncbi:MAG: prolipoprotein diacylglyceryl transferase, partial [Oscillospiraceae bacterium]|nr:prolipoprotein diacylglyceryl transferase [Oscillospiraceae bacterium]
MTKPFIRVQWGDFPIYSLAFTFGMLICIFLLIRIVKKAEISVIKEEKLFTSVFSGCFTALVTSKTVNFFIIPEINKLPLLERIQYSGFTFYFGLFGFLICFIILLKIFRLDLSFWLNEIVPLVILFHAFGRIGCSLAGCCYGKEIQSHFNLHYVNTEIFPAREIES